MRLRREEKIFTLAFGGSERLLEGRVGRNLCEVRSCVVLNCWSTWEQKEVRMIAMGIRGTVGLADLHPTMFRKQARPILQLKCSTNHSSEVYDA